MLKNLWTLPSILWLYHAFLSRKPPELCKKYAQLLHIYRHRLVSTSMQYRIQCFSVHKFSIPKSFHCHFVEVNWSSCNPYIQLLLQSPSGQLCYSLLIHSLEDSTGRTDHCQHRHSTHFKAHPLLTAVSSATRSSVKPRQGENQF